MNRDIVVLYNLRSHKTIGVAEAIWSAGTKAPMDLNPSEKVWGMIKVTLRAVRTSIALHRAIRKALL